MRDDFELIVHKFPMDTSAIRIYPIGDAHIGSGNLNMDFMLRWREAVMNDENGYVVIVGDMIENALKNSKGNSYDAMMRPREQKAELKKFLEPIAYKILGAVTGNHEYRSVNETDDCPLYDVMCKLDVEDLYRENMAFLKVSLGKRAKDRQVTYTLALGHGASRNKTENFSYSMDGLDVFVTGHTHRPGNLFPSKIVIDCQNEQVRLQDFTHVTVPSFNQLGGYSLRGMYMPQGSSKFPVITLFGDSKGVDILWTS
jgi:predicted phosphodiesterase